MSKTYLLNGDAFNIDSLDAPDFLKEYLSYELSAVNLSVHTVNLYYIQIREYIRWLILRKEETEITRERMRKTMICEYPFEDFQKQQTREIVRFFAFADTVLKNGAAIRRIKLTAIRSIYSYFNKIVKTIPENPAEPFRTPKKDKRQLQPDHLTIEESRKVLSVIDGNHKERDFCMFTLFLNCGLRLRELTSLNLSDIGGNHTLRIFGKGRKVRSIYLNTACQNALEEYLKVRSTYPKIVDPDALFVSSRTGTRLSGRRVEQIASELFAKAELTQPGRKLSPHKLRHTTATILYQSGSADIREIQSILGHESLSTTEIYTHLNETRIQEAMMAFPLADPKSSAG